MRYTRNIYWTKTNATQALRNKSLQLSGCFNKEAD